MSMILNIEGSKTISAISDEFNAYFPYLKLGFFRHAHDSSEPSRKREMLRSDLPLKEISDGMKDGKLSFNPFTTVSAFEKKCNEMFNLNVQVFRRSGSVWLETTVTDNLTLQTQNALGLEKSIPVEKPDISDIDYD